MREVRFTALLIVLAVMVLAGCKHNPAYSDMDANRSAKVENKNSGEPSSATTPEAVPAPPASAPLQSRQFKPPSFLDSTNGTIKDLPIYPGARRTNQIVGPAEGTNAATIVLTTSDPMDKIAAFYEQAIKSNKWVVVNKVIDPDVSDWTLKKGEDDNAKVSVNRDSKTGRITIFMVRSEKLEQPPKG